MTEMEMSLFILFANHNSTLYSFFTFFFSGYTITSEVSQTLTLSGHPGCLAFCMGFFILFLYVLHNIPYHKPP